MSTHLRILMISYSFDVAKGAGAAVASGRLRDALRTSGHEVGTLSIEDFCTSPDIKLDQPASRVSIGFWNIVSNIKHRDRLLEKVKNFDPDCIVMGAVDRGIVAPTDLIWMPYPIVWISRDNWSHTGGCLFKIDPSAVISSDSIDASFFNALSCEGYLSGCTSCAAICSDKEHSKSALQFEIKKRVYSYRNDIVFVGLSDWMSDMLRRAPLTKNHSINTIPNPMPIFKELPPASELEDFRKRHKIGVNDKVILFVAQNVTNERKGFTLLSESLTKSSRLNDVKILQIGKGKSKFPSHMGRRVVSAGFIEDDHEKRLAFCSADVTVVPALQESLSVVAAESLCNGVPVVAFGGSGIETFVESGKSGYIAKPFSTHDLAKGLVWSLFEINPKSVRDSCLERAEALFSTNVVVSGIASSIEEARANFVKLPKPSVELTEWSNLIDLAAEDLHYRSLLLLEQRKMVHRPIKLKFKSVRRKIKKLIFCD